MKQYFEYGFDEKIKDKLLLYYNNPLLKQHTGQHEKSIIKFKKIKEIVGFSNNDIVLDVGCSTGVLISKISSLVAQCFGIDIASDVIAANEKYNIKKNLKFKLFNGTEIPFFNERFNKIFLMDVLEHSFNPDKLLDSIKDNLADGGKLVIQVPFSGWLSELVTKKYHQGHLRYYDPNYLVDYLKKFGLKTDRIKIDNSVPLSGLLLKIKPLWKILNMLVNLIPSKMYPYFGEILIVVSKE